MKIKLLWISIVLLTVAMITTMFINSNDRKIISNEYSNKRFVNTNSLTMMYETDVGSGEYQVSTDSEWLRDEYIFNETLSKCENGGILSWNNDTQRIVMRTNSSVMYILISIICRR